MNDFMVLLDLDKMTPAQLALLEAVLFSSRQVSRKVTNSLMLAGESNCGEKDYDAAYQKACFMLHELEHQS